MAQAQRSEPRRVGASRAALDASRSGAARPSDEPFRARRSRCTRSCWRAAAVRRPRPGRRGTRASARYVGTRRASSAAGPATCSAHHWRVASHDLLTALGRRDAGTRRDDVRHRLVARVPDAREDRLGRGGDRPHDRFVLEGRQVRPRSPTTHDGDDVAVAPAEGGDGPGYGGRRAGALHGDPHMGDTEPEPRTRELPEEVLTSLGARAGHQADVERDLGQGQDALRRSNPSASSVWSSWARFAASCPSSAVTSTSARMRLISPLAR